jgi:transposase
MSMDGRTMCSIPEKGHLAGYNGTKRPKGSKAHIAVDTLGHLLALKVTAANEQERDQVGELAQEIQEVTGESVTLTYADQDYTGQRAVNAAKSQGIELMVMKLPEAKKGIVLLPRRWVVKRSFTWASRFRRLARDYERWPQTLASMHLVTYACLMIAKAIPLMTQSS